MEKEIRERDGGREKESGSSSSCRICGCCRLNFVFMEEHVRDALGDGEAATGLGTYEGALFEVELEQGVVEFAKEVVAIEHGGVGAFGEVGDTHLRGGIMEGLPLNLGEDVTEEIRVEGHLLHGTLLHFQPQRESANNTLNVAR